MAHQGAGVLEGESLDIDDLRRQARGLDGRLALLDVLGAGRDQQHVEHVGILVRRSHHLEVVAHFLHREGDVLIGLHLDLALELVLAEGLRHLNHFRDRRVAGDGDCGQPALCAGALDSAPDRLADGLGVDDGLFVDGVVRSGLRRIRLNAVLSTRHRELDELHRRGGDVEPQQRAISFAKREH